MINKTKKRTLIAITGTIGSGKSTFCDALQSLGSHIVSADQIGHQILDAVQQSLVQEFGQQIVTADGKIDKKKLAKLVFADPNKLDKLGAITHPQILEELEKQIEQSKNKLIFVEVPPVFALDISKCFDLVIRVKSKQDLLKDRLKAKDRSYLKRIDTQLGNALLTSSSYTIENDGSIKQLKTKAKELLQHCQRLNSYIKKPFSSVYLPKVCVCVSETSLALCQKKIDFVLKNNHLAEFRLDFLDKIPASRELEGWRKKGVLATLRTNNQGGKSNLCGKEYAKAIYQINRLGFQFIDIEFENCDNIDFGRLKSKIILSYHNFALTPPDLEKTVIKMQKLKPYCVKVATMVKNINDNFLLFDLLQKYPNLIAFGMGEKGELSRILSLKYGSFFTYSFLTAKKAVAPGQIALESLLKVYHIQRVNPSTKVYGLIGQNIGKSFSRAYHNKQFAAKNIDAVFVNFPIDNQEELQTFLKKFVAYRWEGLAVTMPYKQTVFGLLDKVDPTAQKIGAINTIHNEGEKLRGYNTDYIGAISPLQKITSLAGKKVLLLGNGGAAKAILFGLIREKAVVTIAARNLQKSKPLFAIGNFSSITLKSAQELDRRHQRHPGLQILTSTKVGMA